MPSKKRANKRTKMLNMRQQIIQDRLEETANQLHLTEDEAFMRLAHSIVTEQSIHSFNSDDLVDGGNDKQIDLITINDTPERADVFIIQCKNSTSFASGTVVSMANGLDWIFNKSRKEIGKLPNLPLRDQILEIRRVVGDVGPSNVAIKVVYVTNGLSSGLSQEYTQEVQTILEKFDNNTFESFEFLTIGADELTERISILEKKNKRINADLPIQYDQNNPSLIKYHANDLKGIVCTVTAKDIAEIIKDDKTNSIFDSNIRRFLGGKGGVNTEIKNTCSDSQKSHLFWFLNNGITIICESADPVADPDQARIKMKNLQIVNGCQTAMTLFKAFDEKILQPNTRVLVKIYETSNPAIVDNIVLTTNNQNRITARDLKSNDELQIDLEKGFAKYKLNYERKPRQYDNDKKAAHERIIPNEIVGQSYLGLVFKRPGDARRRKYKVWGEMYDLIFSTRNSIEPYILSTLIYLFVEHQLKASPYRTDKDDLKRKIAKNGAFHIARIFAFLFRKTDSWKNIEGLRKQIMYMEKKPKKLTSLFDDSFNLLEGLLRGSASFNADVDNAFKSYQLDEAISSLLHDPKKGESKT